MSADVCQSESHAAYMRRTNAEIRRAILLICRDLVTTEQLITGVEAQTGILLTARQVANMAARLHKAGWLTYMHDDPPERHYLTDEGLDVVSLLMGARR